MADTIKIVGSEINLTTSANTVGGASLVRLINTSDSPNDVLITVKNGSGSTKGTFTLGHDGTGFASVNLVKLPTDTIQANTANATVIVKATSIAFT
jgi:hypothetical protein